MEDLHVQIRVGDHWLLFDRRGLYVPTCPEGQGLRIRPE